MNLRVAGGSVGGTVTVPGDKSISQRAALLGALAGGTTTIEGFLDAEDCTRLLAALGALGISVERAQRGVIIHGLGNGRWRDPDGPLDLGNSGTALRLLAGVIAGRGVRATLTGDVSLRRRPMHRVTEPLTRMGASIAGDGDHAPLHLEPAALHGIDWTLPVASAQVKSCVLLAGLHAGGTTRVTETVDTRDHTERLLRHFRVPVAVDGGGLRVGRCDWDRVAGARVEVPGDASAAAFFAVAAAITPGAEIRLPGIGVNPRRTGFLRILERMGADVELLEGRDAGQEPVADLRVRGGALRGTRIEDRQEVVDAIDELPVLMVAAACADGETVLAGAGELRYKESDRIASMAACLSELGVDVQVCGDGMTVQGGRLRGGDVDARGDHRVAMAAAIAGLRSAAPVVVHGAGVIATSFPGFADTATRAGIELETGA